MEDKEYKNNLECGVIHEIKMNAFQIIEKSKNITYYEGYKLKECISKLHETAINLKVELKDLKSELIEKLKD